MIVNRIPYICLFMTWWAWNSTGKFCKPLSAVRRCVMIISHPYIAGPNLEWRIDTVVCTQRTYFTDIKTVWF
jgi:hypothetical protein